MNERYQSSGTSLGNSGSEMLLKMVRPDTGLISIALMLFGYCKSP